VAGIGDQRHDVVDRHTERSRLQADLGQLFVVHARDVDRVDLDQDPGFDQRLGRAPLLADQNRGGFLAAHTSVIEENPGVDLRADAGVQRIDGQRDMIHAQFRQFGHMVSHIQPVGGQAQFQCRQSFSDRAQRRHGARPVGERIARPCHADHRQLRNRIGHRQHLARGLIGIQHFGHHAGARFIAAIVFAVAIVALDIASRRHRQMDARIFVMRVFRITRMVGHARIRATGLRGLGRERKNMR